MKDILELLELVPAFPFVAVYDGDSDGDGGGDGDGDTGDGSGDGSGDGEGGGSGGKTFTQEEVNGLMSKEKAQHKRIMQQRIGELEKIRSNSKLTASENEAFSAQISDMQKQIETTEEKSRRERETTAKKHTRELTGITEERDTWKSRYTDSIIQRSLTDAAVANNAFNPEQVVAILRPNTEVVVETDSDGKETGRYKAQVLFSTVDDKDQPITYTEDPAKIVKKMLDEDRYMNLFKSDKANGLGMRTSTARKSKGVPKDTAEYIKQRKDGRKNRMRR